MNNLEKKINYKIIVAVLVAVIIGVLIAFYYSYAQTKSDISFLRQERELLVRDITLVKADVDRLSALNEVNEIELEDSKYRVQQLLDSVGKLNFSIEKLKEYGTELQGLKAKNDSLRLKNNFLRYNAMVMETKYEEANKLVENLRGKSSSLAEKEALLKKRNQELSQELKTKNHLKLMNSEGSGFRLRGGRYINTNKANTISRLRGCVTVIGNPNTKKEERIIFYQFLGPNMEVIGDNANTILVKGNVYSKRVEMVFMGEQFNVCDAISIPEGSLETGTYTLNVFEDEKLLASSEFHLK
ncbi:hypothetical protein [Arenibacter certesii]|uniref:Chromosome partitioning protein ParA n=1 Tax=Arenibacter certesii TaxID=228955 RepID=A0A918IPR4_9FLAO|nr:hypothetical protein [Arenibacter certesii]GGW25341.1 hypothetical protein GCM10007383_07860 [Arenibacter certesii]